jgi:hypothetical protein
MLECRGLELEGDMLVPGLLVILVLGLLAALLTFYGVTAAKTLRSS